MGTKVFLKQLQCCLKSVKQADTVLSASKECDKHVSVSGACNSYTPLAISDKKATLFNPEHMLPAKLRLSGHANCAVDQRSYAQFNVLL